MPLEIAVLRWRQREAREERDVVAEEEPLEIRVNAESLTVTMRTPGSDFELAAGLLLAEGLIHDASDILVIKHDVDPSNPAPQNTVLTAIKPNDDPSAQAASERRFFSSSSCGVCGKKDLASIRCFAPPLPDAYFRVKAATIYGFNAQMREAQQVFAKTGGLHAAGLFDEAGSLLSLREDIGRHNAVDKLIGAELLSGRLPLSSRILMLSGRASFEIMQKAAVARIPVVCAVSAPSSYAVRLARDMNMTLIGFLRGDTMNVYTGSERITP